MEKWSGGTTTELVIYPKEANFRKRDFSWRLSTATVDADPSSFTSFPGIWRYTMVLEGELFLRTGEQPGMLLKALEQASYSGEQEIKTTGKAKNFNLMVAEESDGKLHAFHLQKGVARNYSVVPRNLEFRSFTEAFYCNDGKVTITIGQKEKVELENGDLLLLSTTKAGEQMDISFFPEDEIHLIKTVVYT